ncbi:MAG: lytic transglycosylase domain-containing protein [Myxococcales bacterium]
MSRLLLALTSALICAVAPTALQAAALRTWIDRDGVYHVEDAPKARASSRASASKTKARWWERRSDAPPHQIERAAAMYNIPAELIRAVIAAESAGDTSAISHRGAIGLMQLMPQTAGQMYVVDPVDPAQNILGGTRYLRHLANQFAGDMMLVVAAYNAGPEAVRKYRGVPPYEETRQYVKKVLGYYAELKRVGAKPTPASVGGSR